MSKEAMKLALDALKANYELINGSGNHFGLEGAMDGYYSGCFDVKGTNKKTEDASKTLEEALALEWISLTTDEVSIIEHEVYGRTVQKGKHMSVFIAQFAKALDSALKEKNSA